MTGPRYWTCQRRKVGVRCKQRNLRTKQKCAKCGGPRPKAARPAHMTALDLAYEHYVEINGGEHCAICGATRTTKRRLPRDHDHATGKPRGILCVRCNRALPAWITAQWLRDAAAYLERTA